MDRAGCQCCRMLRKNANDDFARPRAGTAFDPDLTLENTCMKGKALAWTDN
jgi:hypothetical protein